MPETETSWWQAGVVAVICAATAALLGLVVIAAWVLGLPRLASMGQDWIPMAPSTALLFLLSGCAILLNVRARSARSMRWAGLAIGSAVALIGLALFILSYSGIRLKAEQLGIGTAGTVDGVPIGYMSPATAVCFLGGGLSLAASLSSSSRGHWAAMAGFWLAGPVTFAGVVFVLAYFFGMPLLYGSAFIPPALPTSIAFAALGLALAALARPRAWPPQGQVDAATLRLTRKFMFVFALAAVLLVILGGTHFHSMVAERKAKAENLLSAMADLKVSDLRAWREQHIGDAELIRRNPAFADLMQRAFGAARNAEARRLLRDWLLRIQQTYRYTRVSLFNAQGRELVSVPDTPHTPSDISGDARRVLQSGRISLEGFRRDPGMPPYLSMLAPILERTGGGQPLGIVAFRIDPARYLYPVIERWPTPSASAETLLVRRDGNDVLFLNKLRFRKDSALPLRIPLTRTELPAAKAVLGQVGMVQGTDYDGQQVLAALRAVPGTPWFLVAKISTRELFGPTAQTVALAVGIAATLLFTLGVVLRIIWRQQLRLRYQERLRADELEQSARKLAQSNAELEQFAYVASHDLQEPLRMVVGYVQLLERRLADKLDAETREFMGFAVDGALRMQAMVQDILAYSRVSTKGRSLAPVDSAACLNEALARLATRISETGAVVTAQTLPVVMADPAQLAQLFQNLIGNAIKFCKDHAPRVQVAATREAGRWRFSVVDNGIGIAPEYRTQLFVIFKRLHTRREFPGTGIGLAICKRIVERHGGDIGIKSAPDGGSAFWFTLPEEQKA